VWKAIKNMSDKARIAETERKITEERESAKRKKERI